MPKLAQFFSDESAATSIEYCFMASLIIFVCIGAIALVGVEVLDLFTTSNADMTNAFNNR